MCIAIAGSIDRLKWRRPRKVPPMPGRPLGGLGVGSPTQPTTRPRQQLHRVNSARPACQVSSIWSHLVLKVRQEVRQTVRHVVPRHSQHFFRINQCCSPKRDILEVTHREKLLPPLYSYKCKVYNNLYACSLWVLFLYSSRGSHQEVSGGAGVCSQSLNPPQKLSAAHCPMHDRTDRSNFL